MMKKTLSVSLIIMALGVLEAHSLTRAQALGILEKYREHPGKHLKTAAGEMALEMKIETSLALSLLNAFKKNAAELEGFITQAISTSSLPNPASAPSMGSQVASDTRRPTVEREEPHRDQAPPRPSTHRNREAEASAISRAPLSMDELITTLQAAGLSEREIAQQLDELFPPTSPIRGNPAPSSSAHAAPLPQPAVSPERETRRHQWVRNTPLVGTESSVIAGFEGVADRSQLFNPLYDHSFPKVPVVHQYHPITSPGGGLFPLLVSIPPAFIERLPEYVLHHFSPETHANLELYWIVQNNISFTLTPHSNIVFRPHYWARPDGQATEFNVPARLLDADGHLHGLPGTRYSVHPAGGRLVVSPDTPIIPFHGTLRSGNTTHFWSFVSHAGRTAITLNWIVNDADNRDIERAIAGSSTVRDLLETIRTRRIGGTPQMIEEIDSIFNR